METGHVQLLISYTLDGFVEEADYDEWARGVAVPWWQDQPGYRSIRGYYTVVGSGARIVVPDTAMRRPRRSSCCALDSDMRCLKM